MIKILHKLMLVVLTLASFSVAQSQTTHDYLIYVSNTFDDHPTHLNGFYSQYWIKQARLLHSQGKYWLVSFADYIDSTITYRTYNYTLQYTGVTSSYSHRQTLGNHVRPQWAAKPTMTHQVAAKYVEIETMGKKFKVWTKCFGNNPSIKLLLLNGGPGMTHEYFECFDLMAEL